MAKYEKYAEYKDSGVEWLGEIPSHWDCFSGKRVFASVRKSAYEMDQQLAASQKYGVIPQKLMMELNDSKVMLALKGTESFRHVEENNFVISLRSFEGGIEYSQYTGCVSPAYTVLQNKKTISYAYFKHLFKSAPYIAALQSTTDSLRDGKSISYEQFGAILLPLCEVDEQEKIANFLDHETAQIDTLIAKQEKLIELLKEKRQAVISHAVTKGLNPDVAMKDSGVEWLGQVPEHWEKKILKYIVSQQGGGTPDKSNLTFWDGDIPWVSPKDMKVDYISTSQDKITAKAIEQSSTKLVPIGSVLMVVRGMILIHSVPVALTQEAVTINQDMKALTPNKMLDSEYFLYLLKGLKDYLLDYVETSGHGTKCLRSDDFMNMPLFLPKVEEQKNIVEYIKNKSEIFDSLTQKAESAIALMQERRTALISSAVTGKIDVRNWQKPQQAQAV